MLNAKLKENLLAEIEYMIKFRNKELAEWMRRFEKNPADAFRWSDTAFRAAAKLAVANDLKQLVTAENMTEAKLRCWVMDKVVQGAKFPPSSNSSPSNLCEQYTTASYAEYLEIIDREAK